MSTISTPAGASRLNRSKGVAAGAGFGAVGTGVAAPKKPPAPASTGKPMADRVTTTEGTSLYFKDWGSWEDQMFFLLQNGYRVIAHDRRGFGRSSQPAKGYDYDTFADDLAQLVNALDLREATFVGHSMGGGEVARYVARHGQSRVAKVSFISSVTPFLLNTSTNPTGAPKEVFDGFRASVQADRSQWNLDVTMPYYSFNRPGAKVSEGLRQNYWRQGQATGVLAAYHALGAFSETDFRDDLKQITVPALVVHRSDDQICPLAISSKLTAKLIPQAKLVVYDRGSHGLLHVDKDRLNADLLAFLRS